MNRPMTSTDSAAETDDTLPDELQIDDDHLDAEVALLALSSGHDIAGPTVSFDLDKLTTTEKRALLGLMRRQLLGSDPETREPS